MNIRNVIVDIQVWLGYDKVYTVEHVGKCGGLALFWKKDVSVEVLFADKNVLDLQVELGPSKFSLSCVYGNPNSYFMNHVWERITRLGVLRKTC